MILFSHPTPTPCVQHTAAALARGGLLGEFWTLSGKRPQLVERHDGALPFASRRSPATLNDGGGAGLLEPGEGSTCEGRLDCVQDSRPSKLLDQKMRMRLSRGTFDGVYAYEQGAEASFQAAARLDLLRVYDVPLGYWRGTRHPILIEEAALQPEWASTLDTDQGATDAAEQARSELTGADLVFVSNSFALQTLEETTDVPGIVAVASPGAPHRPLPCDGSEAEPTHAPGKLRILYAGPLSQRAGLSYAFQACRELGSGGTLTIVSPPPVMPCLPLRRELDRVRWLATASMEVVRREMAAADVFLAPAIYDTNPELLLHALAAGLPIIATAHSAAPDLIRDGMEGYIVPIRSADSIAAKLKLLHREPDLRAAMSRQAHRRALEHSWRRYEDIVIASVATALTQRCTPVAV